MSCWIEAHHRAYVVVCPVFNVMTTLENSAYRKIVNQADMVTPDGMPLVFILRWLGHTSVDRTYGPDLMLAFCEQSQQTGYKSFFYGGAEGIPDKLTEELLRRFPHMPVPDGYSPPFRALSEEEEEAIIEMINSSGADIVWVGLGSPKQDIWMANMLGRLEVPVLVGVGAAFDFISGVKPQAPRWMQRSALEWLFRLSSEPRRLWRRYLIYNSLFIWNILRALPSLFDERKRVHMQQRNQ